MSDISENSDVEDIPLYNRTQADAIIARRHGEGTDAGYDISRKKFKIWLASHYPQGLTGANEDPIATRVIRLPLHRDSTMAFLGEVHRLKVNGVTLVAIPADQPPIAVSTMTAIGSALSDLYKTRNVTMCSSLKSEISNFMKGYRRTINDLKQTGV